MFVVSWGLRPPAYRFKGNEEHMALTRQSLEDLYRAGGEYDISPDGDGSAMAYVRKLGPVQQQNAVRKANAAQLQTKLLIDDPDDPYMQQVRMDIEALSFDEKVEVLAMTQVAEDRQKAEQQISEEEGWIEDGKLQALVDAWEGGLLADYIQGEGKRSEESERVFAEMTRFKEAVDDKIRAKLEVAKAEFRQLSPEAVDRKMLKSQVEYDASLVWMRTFRTYQILYGLHNLEREPLFETIEEVESLPAELFAKMIEAVLDLTTPSLEVKS